MSEADIAEDEGPLFSLRRLDELIAVCCLLAIVFAIAWGVVTRYVLPQPASWTFEVAVMAFAWMVFFGAAAGVRRRMHADIDVLTACFSLPVRRVIAICNWVLLAAFFAAMTALFALQTVLAHGILTVALSLPRSVVYAPLAIASAMMLLQHVLLRPWRHGWMASEQHAEVPL